jgi:hypothetical protein
MLLPIFFSIQKVKAQLKRLSFREERALRAQSKIPYAPLCARSFHVAGPILGAPTASIPLAIPEWARGYGIPTLDS